MNKREQFHKELKELLLKFNAEMSLECCGRGEEIGCKIIVEFEWDAHNEDEPTLNLDLGGRIEGN